MDDEGDIQVISESQVVVLENNEEEVFFISKGSEDKEEFNCKVCGSMFQTKKAVRRHHTVKHREIPVDRKRKKNDEGNDGLEDDGVRLRKASETDIGEAKRPRQDDKGESTLTSDSFIKELEKVHTSTQQISDDTLDLGDVMKICEKYENYEKESDDGVDKSKKEDGNEGMEVSEEEDFQVNLAKWQQRCEVKNTAEKDGVDLLVAKGRISALEAEGREKDLTIQSLRDELDDIKEKYMVSAEEINHLKNVGQTKQEQIEIQLGQIASVEMDRDQKVHENDRMRNVLKKMDTYIEKLKSDGVSEQNDKTASVNDTLEDLRKKNKELFEKVKKLNESVKLKTKALNEAESGAHQLAKSLGEHQTKINCLNGEKARLESEVNRMHSLNKRSLVFLNMQ